MVHQNSLTVYRNQVLPNIKQKHNAVINALQALGEATSLEVADYLNKPLNSLSGRFTELSGIKEYDSPIIEQVGVKKNRYGNTCAIWRIIKRQSKPLQQSNLF
jgi:hypothetical protein